MSSDLVKFAVFGIPAVIFLLTFVPRIVVRNLPAAELATVSDVAERLRLRNDRTKMRNEFRTTCVQVIAGFGLLAGVAVTYETAQANQESTRQAALTAQFTTATNRLANPSVTVRVAAIQELEVIAEDSSQTQSVADVLNGFVGERAPWPPAEKYPKDAKPDGIPWMAFRSPDINAAIRALGQKELENSTYAILTGDLRRANLRSGNYSEADIRDAHMEGSSMTNADLSGVFFDKVWLAGADLSGAKLCGADLEATVYIDVDTNFSGAVADPETKWPEGFDAKKQGVKDAVNRDNCS